MADKVDFEKLAQAAQRSLDNPGQVKKALPKAKSESGPTVFLCRHTQTTDNVARIFSGRRDPVLTQSGQKQARQLAELLKDQKIDLIVLPPLKRCRLTVEPLTKYLPGTLVKTEPLLLERDYGQLTGKSKIELMAKDPKMAVLYRRSYDTPPPGGESIKTVQEKRVYPFCEKLVERIKKDKTNVLICATNNTMRLIRMFFEKLTIEQMLTLENPFGDYASYQVV